MPITRVIGNSTAIMAVRNYKISYCRCARAHAVCLPGALDGSARFHRTVATSNVSAGGAHRASRARARHKNDSSLDFTNRPHRRRIGVRYEQPVAPVIFIAVIMRLSAFPRAGRSLRWNLFAACCCVHALSTVNARIEYSCLFFSYRGSE